MRTIAAANVHGRRFPKRKQRKLRGMDLFVSNPKQDIAWLNARLKRCAARVHVLKNPARPTLIFGPEEGRADSHFPRGTRPPFVIETGMTDLQLLDQFIEFQLEFIVICGGENPLLARSLIWRQLIPFNLGS